MSAAPAGSASFASRPRPKLRAARATAANAAVGGRSSERAAEIIVSDTPKDALVVFTPSGKRGRFPVGTPLLTCARQLGVDIDSVCGGRGLCGRCQIEVATGDFAKHGISSQPSNASEWNAIEERYDTRKGMKPGRRLSCQTLLLGDLLVDVPAESQRSEEHTSELQSRGQLV